MSEVEIFWNALCAKFGKSIHWNTLSPQEQIAFTQSINTILAIIHSKG